MESKFTLVLDCIDDDEWSWAVETTVNGKRVVLEDGCELSRREARNCIKAAMTKHGATMENSSVSPI